MATLATNVSFQCLGLDGKPLAGGKVYTYEAGTTTNKTTFTTMQGDVPNPNPIILDQNGKAKIFLGDGSYRLQIKDSNDALIDDIDQISRYVTQSEFATFQQTVSDGISQLTEIREQIDVYVGASIGDQKGFANGIAPLDANVKIDPTYFPAVPHSGVPQATATQAGVVKLVNNLTTGGTDKAPTAEMVKVLNNQAFGIGQTVKDLKASRAIDTTYTNTTGKAIVLMVNFGPTGTGQSYINITIDGFSYRGSNIGVSGLYASNIGIVPNGSTYSASRIGNAGAIDVWLEMTT